jgi:hypothetical protein
MLVVVAVLTPWWLWWGWSWQSRCWGVVAVVVVVVAARWVAWVAATGTVRWRVRLRGARQRGACGDEGTERCGVRQRDARQRGMCSDEGMKGDACGDRMHGELACAAAGCTVTRRGACGDEGATRWRVQQARATKRWRMQWERGTARSACSGQGAKWQEAREVVHAQLQGRWYSVIGSEQIGFFMEEATHLYFTSSSLKA